MTAFVEKLGFIADRGSSALIQLSKMPRDKDRHACEGQPISGRVLVEIGQYWIGQLLLEDHWYTDMSKRTEFSFVYLFISLPHSNRAAMGNF